MKWPLKLHTSCLVSDEWRNPPVPIILLVVLLRMWCRLRLQRKRGTAVTSLLRV